MRNFILALLSAGLLMCGWLGGTGLTLLAAFVPLLLVVDGDGGFWRTFGWVALALGVWSAATTWWIAMVPGGWPGAVLSPLITVALFGGVTMLYRWTRRTAPRAVALTVLVAGWIAAEWAYTVGEVSFPWLTLGNGFAGGTRLVQWYDTTGVFGGSLWVWVCNILIYNALRSRSRRQWIAAAVAVLVPIAISLTKYHTYKETGDEVTATVVQPDFFPFEKFGAVDEDAQVDTMLTLAARAPSDVDYIVFPETAVDLTGADERYLSGDATLARFRGLLSEKYPAATAIVGATTVRHYGAGEAVTTTAREFRGGFYDVYNSALALDTAAMTIHHKSRLVIGVEKMPWAGRIGWLDGLILDLGGTTNTLGTDGAPTVFPDGTGAAVCWEGVFGEWFGEFVKRGARVMFIVSNDSWWGDTRGYKQLFALSRLRAVESRRAIARSANTGISGFINQRGDVLARTAWDERTAITGVLTANDRVTFYTRYGDYMARIAAFTFVLCVLYCVALRFRKR